MIDEKQLDYLCKKYNIRYKIFPVTGIAILDTGLDEWRVKYIPGRLRPYCLLHKNKFRQTNKFHVQRWLRTIPQVIDCVASHKKVLTQIYSSKPNTYKKTVNM